MTAFRRWRFRASLRRADALSDRGDLLGARSAYEQVVRLAEDLHGSDHLITLTAREDLALTYRDAPTTALTMLEEFLPAFERVAGSDEPRTLDLRANIAVMTGETGDHVKARRLFSELLADCTRIFGTNGERTVAARENLAYAEQASNASQ